MDPPHTQPLGGYRGYPPGVQGGTSGTGNNEANQKCNTRLEIHVHLAASDLTHIEIVHLLQ